MAGTREIRGLPPNRLPKEEVQLTVTPIQTSTVTVQKRICKFLCLLFVLEHMELRPCLYNTELVWDVIVIADNIEKIVSVSLG